MHHKYSEPLGKALELRQASQDYWLPDLCGVMASLVVVIVAA